MIQVTKIFRFEMAHAIAGYDGACQHVHGHSYELQVTVAQPPAAKNYYIKPPGFVLDFKVLKGLVQKAVIEKLDHRLVLSKTYLKQHPGVQDAENLQVWDAEPTAENLLVYIHQQLQPLLPADVQLKSIKLYETADSFAEWVNPVPLVAPMPSVVH